MPMLLPRIRRDGIRASAMSLAIAASLSAQIADAVPALRARPIHRAARSAAAAAHSAAAGRAVVPVTTCADSGAGSLREAYSHAVTGEVIDLGQLTCSRISLTTGALVDAATATDVTLRGPGRERLVIDGNAVDRVLIHRGAGDLHIAGLSIANGFYARPSGHTGGCIDSNGGIELSDSLVSGCVLSASGSDVALGGGVYAKGTVRLLGSVVADNHASAANVSAGGGVAAAGLVLSNSSVTGNTAQEGAGLFVSDAANGLLDMEDSTISGNRADRVGGGLFVFGSPQTHVIENTTFSGNSAGSLGGGIYSYSPLDMYSATIAMNVAGDPFNHAAGVVLSLHSQDVMRLESTIIANNTTADGLVESDLDVNGGMVVGANNLVMNFSAESQSFLDLADTISIDPRLGPLQDNGGRTPTHALLPGSPAIDRGSDPLQLAFDQRGAPFARAWGAGADIGAYEFSDGVFADGFEDGLGPE